VNITFRTDASLQIGTGHVMRCLTLASSLRDRGAECRFVCREHSGHLLDLIRNQGFEAIGLPQQELGISLTAKTDKQTFGHKAWLGTDWATDAEQTRVSIGDTLIDWLIVDHYALDVQWESAMRRHCRKLMVIDDIADRPHECDLLLDQNLFSDMSERYIGKTPANCEMMLGPRYALLQPIYAELHARIPPREGEVRRILVYFGGADANNLTGMAIKTYRALARDDLALDVVINPTNPHAETIRCQIEGSTKITLYERLPSLAPLMAKADLAIGAGGATSWERCCLGLPSIVITLAENQTPIAQELDRLGLIQWLGDASEVKESTLLNCLRDLCKSGLASDWSERCQHRVDGGGVKRVASILMLNAKSKLKVRLARVDDEVLIMQWTNDCLVRQNALPPDPNEQRTHREWFRRHLRDFERCRIYVVETEDSIPIGLVRFDLIDKNWHIDYALDGLASSHGLGNALLQRAIQDFRASMTGVLLFGRVKATNRIPNEVSESFGFSSENAVVRGRLSIAICSDENSWINPFLSELLLTWLVYGHSVAWAHSASDLPVGDICFYLSYGRIVDSSTRARFKNNLVIHESNLPKGRGWSPMSWLIIGGDNRIPVTLLEAADEVDTGVIYLQAWIDLTGYELSPQWRKLQADATIEICQEFVSKYPSILNQARHQGGEASFYSRRRPSHSELNPKKTIAEQFNLLRVVDNKNYPAFFDLAGNRFVLRIENDQKSASHD